MNTNVLVREQPLYEAIQTVLRTGEELEICSGSVADAMEVILQNARKMCREKRCTHRFEQTHDLIESVQTAFKSAHLLIEQSRKTFLGLEEKFSELFLPPYIEEMVFAAKNDTNLDHSTRFFEKSGAKFLGR